MVLNVADAEAVARAAIATVLDVDAESFTVIVQPS